MNICSQQRLSGLVFIYVVHILFKCCLIVCLVSILGASWVQEGIDETTYWRQQRGGGWRSHNPQTWGYHLSSCSAAPVWTQLPCSAGTLQAKHDSEMTIVLIHIPSIPQVTQNWPWFVFFYHMMQLFVHFRDDRHIIFVYITCLWWLS